MARVAGVSSSEQFQPHPMLRVERAGPLVTVTLDRAERRNSQVPSMWSALAEVGAALDSSTRVVVVRAEGPSFSAGLDRAMLTPEGLPGEPSLFTLAAGAR